jgi:DNA-binding CsgD family transcriptional regulator
MTDTTHELIGRERELAELAGAFDAAREGAGGIELLSGEAGVGISRLAAEALGRSGFDTLTGRAREGGTPSYGPIAAALRDCVRAHPDLPTRCGPLGTHLALLLPELGEAPAGASPDTLVEAIAGAMSARSQQAPTALFLDDLQWADTATLELLPRLDERIEGERVLILATYRSDEIQSSHALRRLRNTLRRRRRLREVALGPLTRTETAALIERIVGADPSPELIDVVYTQTQGFPLYVEELTGALAEGRRLMPADKGMGLAPGEAVPIPESVRDAVLLKIDALSADARTLVEAAAVLGTSFDMDEVFRLAGREGGFDELVERGIIRETGSGRAAFRHAITREAVLEEVGWTQRRTLHRTAAGMLSASGAPPEVIAGHWLEAKAFDRACEALLESAERSRRLHAFKDAARAIDRALSVWPDGQHEHERVGALESLAHCAQLSGHFSEAVRALREVAGHPLVVADGARRAEAQRALATVYQLQGAWERTVEVRRAAADGFEAAGLPGEAAVEWLALAGRYTAALKYDAALEAAGNAVSRAWTGQRWDVRARAMGLEGNILAMQGRFEEGRNRVHEGLSLALEHNLTEAASDVYRRLGSVHEFNSDYAGARDAYFTAVDFCRDRGVDAAAHTCLGCVSYIVYRTGEWKRTLEVCREILAQGDVQPGARAIADGVTGLVRAQRGEARQARRLLQSALDISTRFELTVMELAILYGLAVASENDDDGDAADRYYRQLLDRWRATEERHDIIPWLCWAATFFSSRGDAEGATMCAEELASIAAETGSPEALAGLAHALGETALMQERAEEAAAQFEQALEHLSKLEVPLEQALARFRAGVAWRDAGQGRKAVESMTAAYRIARKLGARPLAARIAAQLETLGEKVEEGRHPDTAKKKRRAGLTRRQVEITRLIATGLTNKEIAQQLYLSPRTVDMHVSNILDRLDCRSRTEAAGRARELGVID